MSVSAWRKRLTHGVIPAVPVPFRADGQIDMQAQEAYVAYMRRQPIAGVAVWAHTGRGLFLTREQREQMLRSWRSGLDPGVAVVAGVGARASAGPDFMAETLRMAEEAKSWGADILMAYAPVIYRGQPDQDERIVAYHRQLSGIGLPLILFYLYEDAGGVRYSLPVLRELLALPNVLGIKMATLWDVMAYQDVAKLIRQEAPEALLITGEDRFLGYSLMAGAEAALIGMGSAVTTPQVDLLKAYFSGDAERFLKLSSLIDTYSQATFIHPMEGYIRRMLWTLHLEGVIPAEATHDPFGPDLPQAELDEVRRVMEELKLL